jgi:hypothetical protein
MAFRQTSVDFQLTALHVHRWEDVKSKIMQKAQRLSAPALPAIFSCHVLSCVYAYVPGSITPRRALSYEPYSTAQRAESRSE